MAFSANYPIALAPGMGINAYFAYTVCLILGIPWQTALGCVFISGIIFLLLTVSRIRGLILHAVPEAIRYGTTCGIGLLIAFVGLKEAGIITSHPATFVRLGNLTNPATQISLFGLLVTAIFLTKRIKGAILWGILATALMGIPTGVVKYQGIVSMPPSVIPTFLKLDILGAMDLGLLTVIFVFLFVDIFDTVGTLVGVGEVGGFIKKGRLPRANRALFSDAVGTVVGSLCGTSTVTSYIESAAGISEGAKSGLANVVTGVLFLLALFFSPLVKMIGGGYPVEEGLYLHPVTAPALIIVGSFMMHSVTRIDWKDYSESIPTFLTLIIIPLSFSIANGLAIGFISFAAIKLLIGKKHEVSWLVYLLGFLFILRFLFLK
jgi:AGZA family xanthine/uracil permease-like MFS transporter